MKPRFCSKIAGTTKNFGSKMGIRQIIIHGGLPGDSRNPTHRG